MPIDLNKWPKIITVDKNIVKILSESTYENFPNALKELIINSYDANATEVNINVDLNKESITIHDNGKGMNASDFEFYLRIAGKHREIVNYNKPQRQKIGQFGVGFLSVFPFFKNYSIISKRSGSDEELYSSIPCHLYFDDNNQLIHISDIKINGGIRKSNLGSNEQFTTLELKGFTTITHEFFSPSKPIKTGRYSIKNPNYFTGIEKLTWILSEDLPIEYEEKSFNKLFKDYSPNLPFSVFLNNVKLLRKVYAKKRILDNHSGQYNQIGKIKFQYFISSDVKAIHPVEGRYLKIRNLNVGVGSRESFIGKEIQGGYSRLQQLTGEVHIIEGMNELIKVSREGFNYSPDYEELKSFLSIKLMFYSRKLEEEQNLIEAQNTRKIRSLKVIKPITKTGEQSELTHDPNRSIDYSHAISTEKASPTSTIEGLDTPNITSEKKSSKEAFDTTNILEFDNFIFIVKSDKWNYNKSEFPACKIENENLLIINSNYPLFKGVKHTDIFIKLHLFLLLNFKKGIINNLTYKSMAHEVLKIYNEYIK
ncbi:MAG: ATP-binding protein [Bacteroidales bacterium]|nr:ATP-binding protein [Bacteroidales bacterium]